jgi:glycosyltransferase involved in cell wall biosynthesis
MHSFGAPKFRLTALPTWDQPTRGAAPGVTIILRTKQRPQLLRRALESIRSQTYPHYTVVVVNDGSDPRDVEAIVAAALPAAAKLVLRHNAASVGQVAALNQGLEAIDRVHFAIHDDDDTWAPDFLARTVEFLARPEARAFIGVVAQCEIVYERIDGERIVEVSRHPHFRQEPALSLFGCLFLHAHPPPISQLFRVAALDVAGRFNPAMHVMYDTEWMVRILEVADVAALEETLAHYHLRMPHGLDPADAMLNSVTAVAPDFARLRNLTLNQLLRRELEAGRLGIGYIGGLITALRGMEGSASPRLPPSVIDYLARRAQRYYRWRRLMRGAEAPLRGARRTLLGGRKSDGA